MATRIIKLGMEVRDATTGFKGIAIQKLEQLNGNIQFAIQPPCPPGAEALYPEAYNFDHHMIEYVGPGVMDRVTEVTAKSDIKLGNTVEDLVTGMRGIAIEKATYMNGCIHFNAIGKVDNTKPDTSNALTAWLPLARVKKIDDGIAKKVDAPIKAENGKKPGGPVSRVARASARR